MQRASRIPLRVNAPLIYLDFVSLRTSGCEIGAQSRDPETHAGIIKLTKCSPLDSENVTRRLSRAFCRASLCCHRILRLYFTFCYLDLSGHSFTNESFNCVLQASKSGAVGVKSISDGKF